LYAFNNFVNICHKLILKNVFQFFEIIINININKNKNKELNKKLIRFKYNNYISIIIIQYREMETNPELNSLIVENKNVPETPKKIKKSKPKKKIDFVIEEEDKLAEITIKYNNITYCIDNPNKDIVIKKSEIINIIKQLGIQPSDLN